MPATCMLGSPVLWYMNKGIINQLVPLGHCWSPTWLIDSHLTLYRLMSSNQEHTIPSQGGDQSPFCSVYASFDKSDSTSSTIRQYPFWCGCLRFYVADIYHAGRHSLFDGALPPPFRSLGSADYVRALCHTYMLSRVALLWRGCIALRFHYWPSTGHCLLRIA